MDFAQLLSRMGGGGGAPSAAKPPFVTFKAGQMNSERVGSHLVISNKLRVAADPRKGSLSVSRQPDGMVHIQWRDRSTGALGFDRPVFPDDVTFKRIKSPDVKDRIYELKYKASGDAPTAQRWFFWMQESKPEDDEENVKKFLNSIDNPPAEGSDNGGAGGGVGGGEEEVMSMLQGMGIGRTGGGAGGGGTGTRPGRQMVNTQAVEAALAQLGVMPSPLSPPVGGTASSVSSTNLLQPNFTTPAAGTATSSSVPASATAASGVPPSSEAQAGDEEMDPELAEALRLSLAEAENAAGPPNNNNNNNNGNNPGSGGNGQASISLQDFSRVMDHLRAQGMLPPAQVSTPVESILSPEEIVPLVQADESLRNSLLQHLPQGQQDVASLVEILRSPQLRQAISSLTQALEGGQGSILSNLGLRIQDGQQANQGEGAVGALIAALIAEAERRKHERDGGAGN